MERGEKLIICGNFPPPVHGASMVTECVKDLLNPVFRVSKVDISIGQLKRGMLLADIVKVFTIVPTLFKYRNSSVYYTLSLNGLGLFKDYFFLKILSPQKVIFHLHHRAYGKSLLERTLRKRVLNNRSVIHLSENLFSDLTDTKIQKKYVIGNPLIKVASKTPNKTTQDKRTFIFLGNFIEEKGVLEAIDIFKEIQSNTSIDVFLKIVGNEADISSEYILKYVLNNDVRNVDIIGPLYGSEKDELLQKCGFLLFPTRYKLECYPLVIVEALSFGLQVATRPIGAIEDMLRDLDWIDLSLNNYLDKLIDLVEYPKQRSELESLIIEERFCISNFSQKLIAAVHEEL